MTENKELVVSHMYVDAAFSPETKKAGWAASLSYKPHKGMEKRRIFYSSLSPPYRTHNCAESLAALKAISIVLAAGLNLDRLNVHLDSYYAMRVLYKHYHAIMYFPRVINFPDSFKKNPSFTSFPLEDDYMPLIKGLQEKIIVSNVNIGVFHVKSHVERHPNVPRNKHQENNNRTDAYARIAREAAEAGKPVKLAIVNTGDFVFKQG